MAKAEQIRSCLANMDSEIVKDALSIILAKEPAQSAGTVKTEIASNYKNFAQAILALKRQYKFPELNLFTVEADLVYVAAGDRRVLLTDRDEISRTPAPNPAQQAQTEDDNFDKPADIEQPDSSEDSVENAFEPIKNNESRFSHLEL